MVEKLEMANVVLAIGSGTKGGFGAILIDYSTIHSEHIGSPEEGIILRDVA